MAHETPLKQIIDAALSQIGNVADVDTVVGEPITLPGDRIIIPFSKVSVGFTSGGAEYDGKKKADTDPPKFAGGNGAGVSVTPLGFLVIDSDGVRMLDLKHSDSFSSTPDPVSKVISSIDSLLDKAPGLFEKFKDTVGKKKEVDTDIDDAVEEKIEKVFEDKGIE